MSDEARGRGVSLTIKHSGAKDATWINFAGFVEEVRDDIAAWFGIDRETLTGLTPHELSLTATSLAHGTGAVRAVLGGTPIAQKAEAAKVDGDDPFDIAKNGGSPGPVEPAISPLFGRIEKCQSVDELKELWAENQEAFSDEEIMAAWKARGKALQ